MNVGTPIIKISKNYLTQLTAFLLSRNGDVFNGFMYYLCLFEDLFNCNFLEKI